jgi:hypothetical protein
MKRVSIEFVREANPVPDAGAVVDRGAREQTLMNVLDTPLVARRRPDRRVPSRQWRVLGAMVMALLALTAVALAASGLLSGAPCRPPRGIPIDRNPRAGIGVTVAGTAQLLALRVPDPAGGPPWGMRVLRTTRGLRCVQVGRVVNGQLGVLGQDGVAGNDRRFHALAPSLVDPWDCVTLDAHQHAFIGNETDTAYASGPVFTRSCAYPGEGSHEPLCPAGDRRMLAYGLLGPDAQSLTYLAAGRSTTVAAVGRDGAYLVVLRATARGDTGLAGSSPGAFPGALAITYKDGRSCRPEPGGCALKGYAPPTASLQRVGPVHVHLAIRRYQRAGKSYADLLVTFRAPVAITAANLSYTLVTKLPPACGTVDYSNIDYDVKRGANVTLDMPDLPGNCPGTAIAHLEITRATADSGPGLVALGPVVASLATFRFKMPKTSGAYQPPARAR